MESMPWILLGVLVLLILFAVVAVVLKRKKKTPPDYYTFFIMGIIWLAAGIPLGNYGLSAMGLVLTIVGLANKDKWKENRRTWSHLDKEEKRLEIILIIILGILVVLGFVVFIAARKGII